MRSLEGLGIKWVTDLVGGGTLLESLDELVVNTRLDVDTGTSTTALAVVEENTEVNPRDSILDVGVVKDDIW